MSHCSVVNLSSYPFGFEIDYLKTIRRINEYATVKLLRKLSVMVREIDEDNKIVDMFADSDDVIFMVDNDANQLGQLIQMIKQVNNYKLVMVDASSSQVELEERKVRTSIRPGRISCSEQHAPESLMIRLRLEAIDVVVVKGVPKCMIEYTKINEMGMTGINGVLKFSDLHGLAIEIKYNNTFVNEQLLNQNLTTVYNLIKKLYNAKMSILDYKNVNINYNKQDKLRLYDINECVVNNVMFNVNQEGMENITNSIVVTEKDKKRNVIRFLLLFVPLFTMIMANSSVVLMLIISSIIFLIINKIEKLIC